MGKNTLVNRAKTLELKRQQKLLKAAKRQPKVVKFGMLPTSGHSYRKIGVNDNGEELFTPIYPGGVQGAGVPVLNYDKVTKQVSYSYGGQTLQVSPKTSSDPFDALRHLEKPGGPKVEDVLGHASDAVFMDDFEEFESVAGSL